MLGINIFFGKRFPVPCGIQTFLYLKFKSHPLSKKVDCPLPMFIWKSLRYNLLISRVWNTSIQPKHYHWYTACDRW